MTTSAPISLLRAPGEKIHPQIDTHYGECNHCHGLKALMPTTVQVERGRTYGICMGCGY